MIKKLFTLLAIATLTSCASIKENMPERQACTGNETGKTIAEMLCKKN